MKVTTLTKALNKEGFKVRMSVNEEEESVEIQVYKTLEDGTNAILSEITNSPTLEEQLNGDPDGYEDWAARRIQHLTRSLAAAHNWEVPACAQVEEV